LRWQQDLILEFCDYDEHREGDCSVSRDQVLQQALI
jgi:hypothetical protein